MSFFYHFLLFFYYSFEVNILSFFSYFIGIAEDGMGTSEVIICGLSPDPKDFFQMCYITN